MTAYHVILIGLTASVVLIGVYGYIDYMSDRHMCDMYTGLRDMMDSIKERLRILEDTVESMKRLEVEKVPEDNPNSNEMHFEKKNKVVISEPMDLIDPKF